MATRMSSKKTVRPKTPNRGATIQRAQVKAWAQRFAAKNRGLIDVQYTIGELLSFLQDAPFRAGKYKGGLGKD